MFSGEVPVDLHVPVPVDPDLDYNIIETTMVLV